MIQYNNIEECIERIKNIDIDNLNYDKISTDELYNLSNELYTTYIYDDFNKYYLIKSEEVAKKIIDRCKNADSYKNYLQILKLSNQYEKAYSICLKLLHNNLILRLS